MLENYIPLIENKLTEILAPTKCEYSELLNAMEYSTKSGGKRVRPSLMLEFAHVCGLEPKKALNFACALEMIHTYSLIHDDLPMMDNDDFRRGRPSCHKQYGEATALLAGDALLTEAFRVALSTEGVKPELIVKAAFVLAECAGIKGMIGGQVIDLKYENTTAPITAVMDMYKMKTGALLVAAAKIGCILADASDKQIESAGKFSEDIGLAFQIKDDILDITSTAEVLGKPIGSDLESNKSTYVSHVGLEKAEVDVVNITNDAIKQLDVFDDKANTLKDFALQLSNRIK